MITTVSDCALRAAACTPCVAASNATRTRRAYRFHDVFGAQSPRIRVTGASGCRS